MKLTDVIIAPEKLTGYLLVKRARADKSGYLALAGFTAKNPDDLLAALEALVADGDATETATDRFGTRYQLDGVLAGPNGKPLSVATIWLRKSDERIHFITLMPPGKRKAANEKDEA
jgi:hypothetical protein